MFLLFEGVRNIVPYVMLLSYKFQVLLEESAIEGDYKKRKLLAVLADASCLSCVTIDFFLALAGGWVGLLVDGLVFQCMG